MRRSPRGPYPRVGVVPGTGRAPDSSQTEQGGSLVARAARATRFSVRGAAGRSAPLVFLGVLAFAAVAGPHLWPYDAFRVNLREALAPPSLGHPLGTDENGRDLVARLLLGARVSLGIGLASATLAFGLGLLVGAVAGWAGGALDATLMRVVDLALAFPPLFTILLGTAVLAPGLESLVLLIGVTGWMPVARLTHGCIHELRLAPYVEAARALGATPTRVVGKHLLPNAAPVLSVMAVTGINRAILAEATVSYLGLGVRPPLPTLGNLLIGAQDFLFTAPWLALAPGVALTLICLALYSLVHERALSGPRISSGPEPAGAGGAWHTEEVTAQRGVGGGRRTGKDLE